MLSAECRSSRQLYCFALPLCNILEIGRAHVVSSRPLTKCAIEFQGGNNERIVICICNRATVLRATAIRAMLGEWHSGAGRGELGGSGKAESSKAKECDQLNRGIYLIYIYLNEAK